MAIGVQMHYSGLDTTTSQTGDIPIPGADDPERPNHAVLVVGYDDDWPVYEGIQHKRAGKGAFLIRNSMGTYWGTEQDGYGSLPYAYVTDPRQLVHSFWMVQAVT